MTLPPFWLSAGVFVKVAKFRFYDANITAGQTAKTGETVTLIKTFASLFAAVYTENVFFEL